LWRGKRRIKTPSRDRVTDYSVLSEEIIPMRERKVWFIQSGNLRLSLESHGSGAEKHVVDHSPSELNLISAIQVGFLFLGKNRVESR
jgi:hypothetical protein